MRETQKLGTELQQNFQSPPFLAFDLGAGNGRAFLGSIESGRIRTEEIHRFPNKPVYLGGIFYWDFLYLWDQVLEVFRRCAAAGVNRLAGVGIDTWNVDFGLINKKGFLLMNPVSYRDQSAESCMGKIESLISDKEVYTLTGLGLNTISGMTRLYQFKNVTAPELFPSADTYLPMPDLFRYYLTGEKSGEESILWGSQLVSVDDRTWLWEIIRRFGYPEHLFPQIRKAGTVTGEITSEIRKATGMKEAPVIAVAEHDTISAAVSVYERDPCDIFISTGTWSVMGKILDCPIPDYRAKEFGYLNEIAPGRTVFAKNLMGFYILEECIAIWSKRGINCAYENLISLADASRKFELFIDVNDPALFSTANMEISLREHCDKNSQAYPEAPGPVVRAILEGLVFSYRVGIEDLEKFTGDEIKNVHIIGGGTKNGLLCRMIADGTKRKVTAAAAEPAVLGNIGMQALATGAVSSEEEFYRIVKQTVTPVTYIPGDIDGWDDAYERIQPKLKGKRRYEL